MKIPPGLEHVMEVDPDRLGGEPCFIGTRVPLDSVVDNLAAGYSVDTILDFFPSVQREQVIAILAWERELVQRELALVA